MLRVTEAFLNSDPGDAGRRREGRRARAGRAGVRRRRYGDTQELYKRCPARLADLVRRNDLRSLLDPGDVVRPPADRIKDAYERLWGGIGRCDLQLEDVAPVNGLFPVSATEVRKRMKKLKADGAPGLDGIRKKHLFALELFVVHAFQHRSELTAQRAAGNGSWLEGWGKYSLCAGVC